MIVTMAKTDRGVLVVGVLIIILIGRCLTTSASGSTQDTPLKQKAERLLLEITKVGNEQLIVTQSSKVLVVTPAIKTVVDSGMDAVPILLNAMGSDSISFDAFTRCYSACDQILGKADPRLRVYWAGGCYRKEVDGVTRIFPRGLGDDEKEFRSEVMSDIRSKWQALRKKKER
jgi:hypothetical protein